MKNLKKVLALVLVVVMALGLITVSNAAFTDAASIEKTEAVEVLSAIGVIGGYPDGSFKPEGEVTRAEMAKMVAVIMNKGEDVGDLYKNACKFADSANHWAAGYIAYCAQEGIISGKSETKFDPDGKVTGTEAAKMLLCALGYDADAEGFKGATWASAVLSKAAKIGLVGSDANLTVDMGAALNRDNTAQMMLNALKSDMVEYESTSTISVNGVTINNNSKASVVAKKGAQYAKIDDTAVAAETYTVQLGEEMFKDLEKAAAGTDAFGRATSNWTFDSKPITEAHEEATLTYKDTVKGGELYTALGKINLYNDDWKATYYVDGVKQTAIPATIKSGNLNDVGQIGDVIEIYKDSNAKTIRIIQINYYPAEIAQVWAAKVDANGDETQAAYVQVKSPKLNGTAKAEIADNVFATQTNTVETAAFTTADKGGYAVITVGHVDTDNEKSAQVIKSIAKAELVTGLFSSKSNDSVTIGGTKYAASPVTGDIGVKLNTNATVILDPNGNVLGIQGVESNDYAYLMATDTVGGVEKSVEAVLVFADGTRKTVTLATVSEGYLGQKGLVAYTVDSNGKYELTAPSDTVVPVDATVVEDKPIYTSNTVEVAKGIKANANTVFVVETYDSAANAAVYTTYTGIANVPNIVSVDYSAWEGYPVNGIKAANDIVSLTKDGDTYASFVFVFGAATQGTSKNVTALYLTANDPTTDDGNGLYVTVKAIVDGAETTVKVKKTAYDKLDKSLYVTDNMQLDTNGYITSVGAAKDLKTFDDFVKEDGIYTGTYADGVITFEEGEANTAYSVAATLPVYAYNATAQTFTITTISSYAPADNVVTIVAAMDNTATPAVPTALYIIENNAEPM